ncbi:MAG: aminotransferase class V-fold PLP-dependent enzyme, partial [Lachnospiraceae bacterium]|nr:aminotransferase class V-fold PLP-dependent enzyme [Lachnospiraceae bacterium]
MDIKEIRAQFPLITKQNIAYLDNAATSQKPQCVIDALAKFYTDLNANPMRGLYELSIAATDSYEEARKKTAAFIHTDDPSEVIFTRNASESLNLAANILSSELNEGDEVLVATSEHHSNFLPWKKICEKKGAKVKFLDCTQDGVYTKEALKEALTEKTKVFTIAYISNVFGRINPIREFAKICHENNTLIVADAAQSVAHVPTFVKEDDVDFLAFSGHKMYGPMGIGVLYAKKELLEKLPPFLEGGEM